MVTPVAGLRPRCLSRPQVGRARRAAAAPPRRALPGVGKGGGSGSGVGAAHGSFGPLAVPAVPCR